MQSEERGQKLHQRHHTLLQPRKPHGTPAPTAAPAAASRASRGSSARPAYTLGAGRVGAVRGASQRPPGRAGERAAELQPSAPLAVTAPRPFAAADAPSHRTDGGIPEAREGG